MVYGQVGDKRIIENMDAVRYLRSLGLYTEQQLQELYDKQVLADKGTDYVQEEK